MLQYVITAIIVAACVIFIIRKLYLFFNIRHSHNADGCDGTKPCAGCDDAACPFARQYREKAQRQ